MQMKTWHNIRMRRRAQDQREYSYMVRVHTAIGRMKSKMDEEQEDGTTGAIRKQRFPKELIRRMEMENVEPVS